MGTCVIKLVNLSALQKKMNRNECERKDEEKRAWMVLVINMHCKHVRKYQRPTLVYKNLKSPQHDTYFP